MLICAPADVDGGEPRATARYSIRRIALRRDMCYGLSLMRQFRPPRLSSGVLAVCIAYVLAIQALMASIGLGMSAFAVPGPAGLVICRLATPTQTPTPDSDDQRPGPAPQCPFCYIATQSAGHIALAGEAAALPAYAALSVASALDSVGEATFVPQFRRTTGDPRAPPALSV
jgi:hypothetical protein